MQPYDRRPIARRIAEPFRRALIGALALPWCIALASAPAARAQSVTAGTLVERARIQDLITRYYYNFGRAKPESFTDFYAAGAELTLGSAHFKGRAEIAKAYARARGSGPSSQAYAFNVTISNPLIVVHGDTASAQLIFTEFVVAKRGEAPRIRTQGREYATFVKVKGAWRYKTRAIEGGTRPPTGWKE